MMMMMMTMTMTLRWCCLRLRATMVSGSLKDGERCHGHDDAALLMHISISNTPFLTPLLYIIIKMRRRIHLDNGDDSGNDDDNDDQGPSQLGKCKRNFSIFCLEDNTSNNNTSNNNNSTNNSNNNNNNSSDSNTTMLQCCKGWEYKYFLHRYKSKCQKILGLIDRGWQRGFHWLWPWRLRFIQVNTASAFWGRWGDIDIDIIQVALILIFHFLPLSQLWVVILAWAKWRGGADGGENHL